MDTQVGLIGLGFLGGAIGARLVATGPPPVVRDVVLARQQRLVDDGAVGATSNRDLAAICDVVLLCVQTDQQCIDKAAAEAIAANRTLPAASLNWCEAANAAGRTRSDL